MHACASAYAWARCAYIYISAKYQPHWKKSRVIRTGNSPEGNKKKGRKRDKNKDKETNQCTHPKGTAFMIAHSRCSLIKVTSKISRVYALRIISPPMRENDNATVYFSSASNRCFSTVSTYPWLMRLLWLFVRIILINGAPQHPQDTG